MNRDKLVFLSQDLFFEMMRTKGISSLSHIHACIRKKRKLLMELVLLDLLLFSKKNKVWDQFLMF